MAWATDIFPPAGLLTVQEVARQFESNSLQQAVHDVRDSLREWAKSRHLAEIFALGSTGQGK